MMMFFSSGCNRINGLVTISTDKTLPTIQQINVLVEKSSVGFEWPAIKDKRVKGINIYRSVPGDFKKQKFTRIATLGDRYATHYVDRSIRPNMRYMYTLTTFGLLHESAHGKIIRVKTSSAYKPVEFVKVYLRATGVVKVLWKPHSNPRISGYVIQRKLANKKEPWHYLASVSGRLMPEYIDASVAKGHHYAYRVIARSNNGVLSQPSQAATIMAK
jgi:fibronectin type 3 domain-containing protein